MTSMSVGREKELAFPVSKVLVADAEDGKPTKNRAIRKKREV